MAHAICEDIRLGGGLIAITGEPGSGKSYVLQLVSKELQADIDAILFWYSNLTFAEMLDRAGQVFEGIGYSALTHEDDHESNAALEAFRKYLKVMVRDGKAVALLVDDAQNAPLDTLMRVLSLSQEKLDGRHLLQVVLTGLPELERLLEAAPLQNLREDSYVLLRLRPPPAACGGSSRINMAADNPVREPLFAGGLDNMSSAPIEREGDTPSAEESTERGPLGPEAGATAKRAHVLTRVLGKLTSACSIRRPFDTREAGEAIAKTDAADVEKGADKQSVESYPDLAGPIKPDNTQQRTIERSIDQEESINRTENLIKVLKTLQNGSGDVEAAALISEDGLIIESALPQDLDETRAAAMSTAILNLGTRVAIELGQGSVQEVVVRSDHGYAVTISAGRGVLLLVVANENARLGLILLDMREAIKSIRQILW
jgi:predicted regulator of Ras-like GTPase activity (Roadblock/LC7/MglB family)